MPDQEREWPTLDSDALHGLAGDVVQTLAPHTEADVPGLLLSFLVGFGCMAGPWSRHERTPRVNPPRLNAVLVGESGIGRKGTAQAEIEAVLKLAEQDFWPARRIAGVSSGPAMARFLRQAHDLGTSIGRSDLRFWIVEEEFVRVLQIAHRTGLSAVLRDLFERGAVQHITTRQTVSIHDAHVSVIGHITEDEFFDTLLPVEAVNGFLNRFMFGMVRMSQLLPEEQAGTDPIQLQRLGRAVHHALEFARSGRTVRLSLMARSDYNDFRREHYDHLRLLGRDRENRAFGAAVRRGDTHVMRLAVAFALLDLSEEINLSHLAAAKAVWKYSLDSAAYLFGFMDPNRDRRLLVEALEAVGDRGLTTGERRQFITYNPRRLLVEQELIRDGLVQVGNVATEGRGRPKTVMWLSQYAPEG